MKSCSTLSVFATITAGWILISIPAHVQAQSAASTAVQHAAMAGRMSAGNEVTSANSDGNTASPAPAAKPKIVALGTTLLAEFSGSVNVRKLKPGDKIKAVLAQDLLVAGRILAPSESRLIGHVTEVKRRSENDPESRLGIVFDKIVLKKHRELDFEAIVQALAPPVQRRSRVDEPDQMMPPPTLTVTGSMPGQSNSRGQGGSSRSTSSATTLATTMGTSGPMTTVGSTPGSNPGDAVSIVRTAASTNASASGGVGMHGVYGLKNLVLRPPNSSAESGPAIVSTKSDVKLESGTQVVLLVVD